MFLYTNDKLLERQSKKTIPFILVSKRIKYFGISLTKEMKEIEKEIYGKIFHAHGLEEY